MTNTLEELFKSKLTGDFEISDYYLKFLTLSPDKDDILFEVVLMHYNGLRTIEKDIYLVYNRQKQTISLFKSLDAFEDDKPFVVTEGSDDWSREIYNEIKDYSSVEKARATYTKDFVKGTLIDTAEVWSLLKSSPIKNIKTETRHILSGTMSTSNSEFVGKQNDVWFDAMLTSLLETCFNKKGNWYKIEEHSGSTPWTSMNKIELRFVEDFSTANYDLMFNHFFVLKINLQPTYD